MEGMRREVLEYPDDDGARLRFADWCEDNEERGRAELIRLQVEKATLVGHENEHPKITGPGGQMLSTFCAKCDRLQLLEFYELTIWGSYGTVDSFRHALRLSGLESIATKEVRRGFVEAISLPLAAFMEHAEGLFREHPITSVTLTGRKAYQHYPADRIEFDSPFLLCIPPKREHDREDSVQMYDRYRHMLPPGFGRLIGGKRHGLNSLGESYHGFDTPDLADLAISRACVSLGRESAGLSPLAWREPGEIVLRPGKVVATVLVPNELISRPLGLIHVGPERLTPAKPPRNRKPFERPSLVPPELAARVRGTP